MSAASGARLALSSSLALPPPAPSAATRCQQHHRRRRLPHCAAAASPEAAAAAPGAAAALASLRIQTNVADTVLPAAGQQEQQQPVSGLGSAAGIPPQQHGPRPQHSEHPQQGSWQERQQQQQDSEQGQPGGPGEEVDEERAAKELNKAICAAQSHSDLLGLVALRLTDFSLVNSVTAFHRLAKHSAEIPVGHRAALRRHPVTAALVTRLERLAGELDELQTAQVLWAHAQLRHGSRPLVDRLYGRLGQAVVSGPGSEGADDSAGDGGLGALAGRQRRRRAAPLRLHDLNAVVMLCYAQAKLGRPVRGVLLCVANALLAAPDWPRSGTLSAGGGGGSGSERGGGTASGGEDQEGGPAPTLSDGLGALSGRSLCLLLWSLASMGALPPALLLRGTRELRRRGLGDLSVHSMCLVIIAQELCWQPAGAAAPAAGSAAAAVAHAAASSSSPSDSFSGNDSYDGDSEEQLPGSPQAAPAAATAMPPGSAAAVPGCWDQAFMNAVAAELAERGHSRRSGFWLNGQDCCVLARGFALAWQAALGWGGGGSSSGVLEAALENRLVLRDEMQRHIRQSPHRRALMQLLTSVALAQAPQLNTRGLTSLAWSLTFLLRPSLDALLLDALALRAAELGHQQRLDAQAVAGLAWSYSTLKYDHPELYECLAHAVLRMLGRDSAHSGGSVDSGAGSSTRSVGSSSAGGSSGGSMTGVRAGSGAGAQRSSGKQRQGGGEGGGSAFTAQTVSVLIFAFAAANRFDSPAQRKMMEALAELADAMLLKFTPQGLANLAWGLTVAGIYPPQLVRRWRAVAGAERRFFRPAELNQLHLVEVALRLEAPPGAVQGRLPADAASFFDSLYQAGRLRAFAGRAWARHQEAAQPVVTDFQQQVYRTICALGVPCQLEHSAAGEYSIDVAIPEHRIAVEVDGPVHFACNSRHLTGSTVLKRRLLQRLGWRPVDVPFFECVQAGDAPPPSASTLAQRAQRLSILQYQRGKLSKQGLVARKGLQAAASAARGSSGGGGGGGGGGSIESGPDNASQE
ncbi:hypothetical protein ABPG75_002809 [Micractinium tetrahymenae]